MLSIAFAFLAVLVVVGHVHSTGGIHNCVSLRQSLSNVSVVTEHIYTKVNCCFEMNPSTVQQTFLLTLGPSLVSDRRTSVLTCNNIL
jgi:hypothetical protein